MASAFFDPPTKRPLAAAADPATANGAAASNKRFKPQTPMVVPAGHVAFRFLCHSSRVSGVIGRGGAAIKQLQSDTSSKIRIEDSLPGSEDRVIVVAASSAVCRKMRLGDGDGGECDVSDAQMALIRVFERVLNVAAEADGVSVADLGGGTVSCRLLAEANQAGSVIGKGGKVVERIRRECGCKIRVLMGDKLPVGVADADEVVEIEGAISSLKKALIAVSSCLQECPVQADKPKAHSRPLESASLTNRRYTVPDVLPLQTSVLPKMTRSLFNHSLEVKSLADEIERGSSTDLKAERLVVFKLLCAQNRVGGVIGKGGSIIKALQEETGVAISIGPSVAGCDEQLVVITSTETLESHYSPAQHAAVMFFARSVERAEKRVEVGSSKPSSVTARIVVPENQVGCLLGKGGAIISELRNATGAKIHIIRGSQVPKCASDQDEVVEISGEISNVKDALYQVTGRLRDLVFPSKRTNIAEPNTHSSSVFETNVAGPQTHSSVIRDMDIRDIVQNRAASSSLYGRDIFDPSRNRMTPLSDYDSNVSTFSRNYTLSSPYDSDVPDVLRRGTDSFPMYETSLDLRPRQILHQSIIPSRSFHPHSSIAERRDYPEIPHRHGLSPSSSWTSQTAGVNRRSYLDIDRDLTSDSGNLELGRERIPAVVTNTSVEISVPEYVINSLYSGSGDSLARFRRISGAKIEVREPLSRAGNWTIVMSGSPDQTQVAQNLLNAFLQGPL